MNVFNPLSMYYSQLSVSTLHVYNMHALLYYGKSESSICMAGVTTVSCKVFFMNYLCVKR